MSAPKDLISNQNYVSLEQISKFTKEELCSELEAADREGLWVYMIPQQRHFLLSCSKEIEFNRCEVFGHDVTNREVAESLNQCFNSAIDEDILDLSDIKFELFMKYDNNEFALLQKTAVWEKINHYRQQASFSIRESECKKKSLSGFENANFKYIKYNLLDGFNLKLLEDMNRELLVIDALKEQASPIFGTPGKIREEGAVEASDPTLCYIQGSVLKVEFDNYVDWFNNTFQRCLKKEYNPIVFAALAYQRFVSLHPFNDGNGRTGRLLADIILRNFRLLPPVWKKINIGIFPYKANRITPTQAVETLIESLEKVYELIPLKT